MAHAIDEGGRYGLLAEFDSAESLLAAAHKVHDAGYTRTDAFSPIPVHGLAEALGFEEHLIPKIVLCGGLAGLIGGYGLECWTQVMQYPLNIGGRPYHSWVAFIPPAYETTILLAALSCFGALLFLCGFPQPYHPVFNAASFRRASQDTFFLVIEAADTKYDEAGTRVFLESLHAREVVAVEN